MREPDESDSPIKKHNENKLPVTLCSIILFLLLLLGFGIFHMFEEWIRENDRMYSRVSKQGCFYGYVCIDTKKTGQDVRFSFVKKLYYFYFSFL